MYFLIADKEILRNWREASWGPEGKAAGIGAPVFGHEDQVNDK
jgi:hypothetical protein